MRKASLIVLIKINISVQETLPGICDIIKPSKNLYNKILTSLATLILELDNILPNTWINNNYESLYLLYKHEEEVKEDNKEYKSLQDTYIKNASLFKWYSWKD